MMPFIFKPLCIALLLSGLFSLVWLRSNVVTLEYKLSALEKKKAEYLKERRILLAEKASLQSFESVGASLRGDHDFVFPDRVKVVHVTPVRNKYREGVGLSNGVKRQKGSLAKKASLEKRQSAGP
ncbi:MAG: hypothetical protein AB1606_03125 [Nitrospirota bacterium]